jgi:hypothetical protein
MTLYHSAINTSTKAHWMSMDIIIILGRPLLVLFIIFTLVYFPHFLSAQVNTGGDLNNNNKNSIIKDPDKEVPSLVVTFDEKEVEMDPFMYSQMSTSNMIGGTAQLNETQNQIVTKIGNANLFGTQSDIDPKLNLKQGDTITLSYGKQPLEIKAYLIDYDTEDENEIYPIKQIDYSTFSIPMDAPDGLKNLEVRCFFENNEQITYTTSVFVETNTPIVTTQDTDDENNNEENTEENDE